MTTPLRERDWVLICWLFLAFVWDAFVLWLFAWEIFRNGASKWWLLMWAILTYQHTLFQILKKRYGLATDDAEDNA